MAEQSLTEYVHKLLKSGYDIGTIRSTLINAGYSPAEINRAITYAQNTTEPRKTISLNLPVILISITALIIIILIILAAIKILTPETKTISMEVSPIQTEVRPGEDVLFLVLLTSNINRKETSILSYEIIDPKTEKIILTKQEKIDLGLQLSRTAQISMPADINPGQYNIQIIISHKQGAQQKSLNFDVKEPILQEIYKDTAVLFDEETAPEEVKCPESCDDFNPCTIDYCEKGICRHTPIVPCCGNGICEEGENEINCPTDCAKTTKTPQEIIIQAKKIAAPDPEAAAMLCNKLTRQNDMDICFSEVAITSGKSIICENIQSSDSKDTCYMEFALKGDYIVCSNVKNKYLSQSCNSLKRSSTLLAQAEGMAIKIKQ